MMKPNRFVTLLFPLFFIPLTGLTLIGVSLAKPTSQSTQSVTVHFSPKGGCQDELVNQLNKATKSIDMQSYSFTNPIIAKALGDAAARGVTVRLIWDSKASVAIGNVSVALKEKKIEVWLDGKHPIAHNKIILIDNNIICTGSYNFTRQAEYQNAENSLILIGYPDLMKQYEDNFEEHLAHSTKIN